MTARDELRGTLSNIICNASNYTRRAQPYLLGSDMSTVLNKTADAILAAGYRKVTHLDASAVERVANVLIEDGASGVPWEDASGDDRAEAMDKARVLLEAAGYREPRTITTAEELDALAEGTKLYSPKTTHSWELRDFSIHGGVKVTGTGGGYTYIHDFIKHEAPLTVLHEPEPQP